jgi:hypothetical protein
VIDFFLHTYQFLGFFALGLLFGTLNPKDYGFFTWGALMFLVYLFWPVALVMGLWMNRRDKAVSLSDDRS